MNSKLALNKYNCTRANMEDRIYQQKCRCLPKEDRKIYKGLLNEIKQAKRSI